MIKKHLVVFETNQFKWKKDRNHFSAGGSMDEFIVTDDSFVVKSSTTGKELIFSIDHHELERNEWFDGEMIPYHSVDEETVRSFTITLYRGIL